MSVQVHESDICIVGNGAVGKAAALGFAQAGLRVNLLCAPASVLVPAMVSASMSATILASADWDVRVYALNHVAHGLLSSLKVWDALDLSRVAPVTAMQVQGGGADAGKLGFDAYGAHATELAWIVEDKNLNQALDTAMRFAQNLTLVQGRAQQLSALPDGAQIRLEDGSLLRAALVVGADGAQSWVRGACDIGLDYRSYHQQGVVTNFECEKPHHGVAQQWFVEDQGIIALLPLPGNRVSLVWSAPDVLAQTILAEPLSALVARLMPYCADSLGQLTPVLPEAIRAFPLSLMRPHSMIASRVALVGDAAHVVHPLAGHGMNLGFADVADLLRIMKDREAYRDCGEARLLERYKRARKEEVMLMQLTTDGLSRLFASDLAPVRLIRDLGLNLLDRLPVIKGKLIAHAMGKSSM
ncbi:FAD-dependent monooxygenase [Undibacterium sp. TJN19]|uniref:FAD-dependent monooxygenase n=1 Tax=Undibacterium sp. TJN19 TaxID=3413055 RepID=UPI003BF39DFE